MAWKLIPDPPHKPKKVPVNPSTGHNADTSNRTTWGTRRAAELRATRDRLAGIGTCLGHIGDGMVLAGIDLDTCRDSECGEFTPWAAAVIERFNSYTEVSPSNTGAKIFFRLRAKDLDAVLIGMHGWGENTGGKKWSCGGGDHPPAIELYLSKRYFTVTEQRLEGAPEEVRIVDIETVYWLIDEAGPALAAANGHDKAKGPDNSRNARACRAAKKAVYGGAHTFEEMREALYNDPDTEIADWCREKGEQSGGRQLKRIWTDIAQPAIAQLPSEEWPPLIDITVPPGVSAVPHRAAPVAILEFRI